MSNKLFAIVFPIQEAQIKEWCWGSCGKGLAAAVDLGDDVGLSAVLCRFSPCPHLERELSEPCGSIEEGDIYLRKLNPLPEGK